MATKTTNKEKSTSRPKPARAKKATPKGITAEDIQLRAVAIYQERMNSNQPGDELSDWLAAEKELLG